MLTLDGDCIELEKVLEKVQNLKTRWQTKSQHFQMQTLGGDTNQLEKVFKKFGESFQRMLLKSQMERAPEIISSNRGRVSKKNFLFFLVESFCTAFIYLRGGTNSESQLAGGKVFSLLRLAVIALLLLGVLFKIMLSNLIHCWKIFSETKTWT